MIHTVKSGESVFSIATDYQVSPADLIAQNALTPPYNLLPGQSLLILYPSETYTVQEGDTLFSIAAKYGIEPTQILQYNPILGGSDRLTVGQRLVISYSEEKQGTLSLAGYAYPFISQELLRSVLPYLESLHLFTYGFDEQGALIPIEPSPLGETAAEYGTRRIMELTTLGRDGRFESQRSSRLFADEAAQNRLISEIAAELSRRNLQGVELDLEYIPAEEANAYVAFTEKLAAALHPLGYTVSVALAPKTSDEQPGLLYEGIDYARLGAAADAVLLMTYEWGYAYGPPLAVAPIDKVRAVLDYALTRIPPEKIYLGFPNYGYDWTLPYQKGNPPAPSISYEQALELAQRYQVPILYDEESQSPYFYYTDEAGREHVVWFEDLRSAKEKLALAAEKGIEGLGIWTVLRRFPGFYLLAASEYDLR